MKSLFFRWTMLVVFFGLIAPTPVPAQQKSPAKSAAAKTETKPAAAAAAKKDPLALLGGFDTVVSERMKDWKVPGLAIAIVKDGHLIYAKGYGLRNVKQNLPATENTLFAIGSCTKAFTAAAAGILVDEGKLKLDTPVREYLPDFKMHDDYITEHMTPRDLMTHRSGLPRHDLMWYGSPFSRKELYDRLRYLEASRGFREVAQYQNLMYMTAGYLVETVSKTNWDSFIQKHFFEPLEMKTANTSVNVSQKTSDFSLPYEERKNEVVDVPFRNIDSIGPAGSINASVTEMANWVMMQMNKGKFKDKQVISAESLRQTQIPQVVFATTPLEFPEQYYSDYGMGWGVSHYRGYLRISHTGGIDGFSALVSMLPRDGIGIVILTNLGSSPMHSILANNIYDRLLELPPVDWNKRVKDAMDKARKGQEEQKKQADAGRKSGTTPSHSLADYAGKFEHPAYGTLRVEVAGDSLKVAYNGLTSTLRHFHYDVFQATDEQFDGMKFTFELSGKGDVDRISVPLESSVKPIEFTRAAEGRAPDKAIMEKLVGEWELTAAPVSIKVSLRGETLFLTAPNQPDYELLPVKGLEFNLKGAPGFSIEFKKESDGSIKEGTLTQPNGTFAVKKK